jgi:probable HAF family extracellular repeat protein
VQWTIHFEPQNFFKAFKTRVNLVERHAMLWEGGVAINLGNLGGTENFGGHHACAINHRGQVVGHSDLSGGTTFHTFIWTWETGMQDLPDRAQGAHEHEAKEHDLPLVRQRRA